MDIDVNSVRIIEENDVTLPVREKNTHKGDYGKILIIGGCVGYTGAPTMCAKAALRAGAGVVYIGVPASIYEITAVKNDEAMPFLLPADADGRLAYSALPAIMDRLNSCGVCVLGPGLGRSPELTALVREILLNYPGTLLLDADGLYAAAQDMTMLDKAAGKVIVTPHEGEFTRMSGVLSNDRAADARKFSLAHGCVTVLKGSTTAIAFPHGEGFISNKGNPGMATGGSGDVLAGIIGGLSGQLPIKKAVLAGVYIHGAAGDLCARRLGEYSMLPDDIIETVPEVMKSLIK